MKYIIIIIFLFSLPITCFGWDILNELNVHEPINDAAVSYFLRNFSNYKTLDEQEKYQGIAWHSGSAENITLNNSGVSRTETFRNWVKIGGVDADVESEDAERIALRDIHTNEVTQTIIIGKPLRHFYDPIFGKKWLTDFPDAIKLQFTNPEIDHVQWAIYNKEHHWSFNQGLLLYKAAMENTKTENLPEDIANFDGYFTQDGNLCNNLFAASFRALGEAMHGAADLCVPAHVRNDSHPGFPFVGGTDPIEKFTSYSMAKKILTESFAIPSVNFLNQVNSVEDLMVGCAAFTNSNFFSCDTICNDSPKVEPDTFNKNFYPNPRFSETDLLQIGSDSSVFEAYKTFPKKVVLARKTITSYVFGKTERYGIPGSAAEGQASVLLPLAAAAGGEIIDRFLPTMKLGIIVEKDNNSGFKMIGSLTHEIEKDMEWKSIGEIKYNGAGEIHVNGSVIATATFVDGQMTATATFNDKDKVQLIVTAGALIHKSNIVEVSVEEAIPPTLTSLKGPEFTQILSNIGLDSSSRRVGYVKTEIPDLMATIQSYNSKYMVFNWWVDNAAGTIADAYFGGEITATNLEKDSIWLYPFERMEAGEFDLITKFEFSKAQYGKLCIPGGDHILHVEGYYHENFILGRPDNIVDPKLGLLGTEGNYRTVNLDVPFTVQQLNSPVKQPVFTSNENSGTKREISFSKIETNPEARTEGYNAPAWAPSDWHCLFRFDGAYTYYFYSKENNPNYKISGQYKDGNPDGLWEIVSSDHRWKFAYGVDVTIESGVEEYNDKNELVKKYTISNQVSPNFIVTHDHANDASNIVVTNAHVETFGDVKEEYDLGNGKKNGSYFYASQYSTVAGSYLNNIPTGHWQIISGNYREEFDLNSDGVVLSGLEKYENDNLEFKYTSSDFVTPSFEATFMAPTSLSVKTGKVEWFHDSVKEVYHIKDYKREGPYNSTDSSNGKTIQGQYANGSMTGVWTYFDPARNPPEYTKTY